MACRLLFIAIGLSLSQVRNCLALESSVNMNLHFTYDLDPDLTGWCECQRTQEVFHILQTIVTGSGLKHLIIITDTTQQGCGELADLPGVPSTFSCSTWDFNFFWTTPVYHKTTLSSIIINCDANTTERIVQELVTARSSGGVERRLLLPVYNLIFNHLIDDNVTFGLDLSCMHQVSIVRNPRPTMHKAGCWRSEYKIQTREGHGGWRVMGRYRDTYHGDPGFIRNKFVNFEGMQLKVTHLLYSPFTMRKNGVYYGFCLDLLKDLASQLNFTYKLISSIDGKFGIKQSNGHWNGMMGMMEREEVDMVVAGLTITGLRETVVDFSIPFFEEPSVVLARADVIRAEVSWSYLFDPLQFYVWMAVAGSLVICAVIINAIERLARFSKYHNKGAMSHVDHTAPSLEGSAWLMLCIYAKQAAERIPLTCSVRLSLGVLWVLPLLLGWLYSANLTASLATVETQPPFSTLEQLANDTEYILLMNDNGVQRLVLENSKSGVYAALWAKVIKTKDVSLLSGTNRALRQMFNDNKGQKKYAVIADKTSIQTKLSRDYGARCDWALIPETFFTSGLGIALPEGSPYKEVFDKGVITTMSSGLALKYQRRNFYKPTCGDIKQGTRTESRNISLGHVKTIFILLLAGITVSGIVLLMEHAITKTPYVGKTEQI